jgi:hypothetical protein
MRLTRLSDTVSGWCLLASPRLRGIESGFYEGTNNERGLSQ